MPLLLPLGNLQGWSHRLRRKAPPADPPKVQAALQAALPAARPRDQVDPPQDPPAVDLLQAPRQDHRRAPRPALLFPSPNLSPNLSPSPSPSQNPSQNPKYICPQDNPPVYHPNQNQNQNP